MIICPRCGNQMRYRLGDNSKGHYEFYGCSTYPHCRQTVNVDDAYQYDDGKPQTPVERSDDEEAENIRDTLLSEGSSWEEAEYARHMWKNF